MFQRLISCLLLALLPSACLGPSGALPDAAPLQSVAQLDLERYVGTWYEISRYPVGFQDGLVGVTANYTLREDGCVDVLNEGRVETLDGKLKSADAKGWVSDPEQPGQLAVRFFWPFTGDYWVIALDPEYRWAVVGEPKRRVLWVLAREPELDAETYAGILERITASGYDIARLELTPQPPADLQTP